MTMCYKQMDHDWTLCNANYHQMVQVMIQLVKNLQSKRIDAPELHPGGMIQEAEENANECENDCEYNQDLEVVSVKKRKMLVF